MNRLITTATLHSAQSHQPLRAGETRCGHDEGFRWHLSGRLQEQCSPKAATIFPDALVFLHGDKRVAGSSRRRRHRSIRQ